jgi:ribosomal-protein-alanine N-acetyltransferase
MLEYNESGGKMPLKVRYMRKQDIAQVTVIDHEAFPTEWPPTNFPRELENKLAYYIIAYENTDAKQASTPKSVGKETAPGLFSRILRIFSRREPPVEDPPEEVNILGFAGMWIMADEAHVTSIASDKEHRHQGIGEVLLISLIELAIKKQARIVTLEARVSNQAAQNLYYKFGFDKLGVRKAYYLDNKEDAVIMSTEYIGSPSFREKFTKVKEAHRKKSGDFINELPVN